MRLGKPFVPVLRQRHGDSSNGRERPGERPSSVRQNIDYAKQDLWNEICWSRDEMSSSAPLSARSNTSSTKPSALTRQSRRSTRGTTGLKGGKSVAGCSSSTGGTGSGTGLSSASALSSFWSHIDDLDQDLQHRAAQLKTKGRTRCVSTPTEATFSTTPDMSSKDVSFAETPEANDMFFADGPEVSFFDHKGITDAEFVCMEGSLNLDDCDSNSNVSPKKDKKSELSQSNWLADLPVATMLLEEGSLETPCVSSALSSPDVSSTAFRDSPQMLLRNPKNQNPPSQRSVQAQVTARPSLGTGNRTPRGSTGSGLGRGSGRLPSGSKYDGVVDQLTRRIHQLEGELEQAVDALTCRQSAAKRSPRRCGSAPPARRHQANSMLMTNVTKGAPAARSLLTGSPQATPRIMCRETLTETEGSQGHDPGTFFFAAAHNRLATADPDSMMPPASRIAHICQMMQAERKSFLDTLHEVCKEVGVSIDTEARSVESEAGESMRQSTENQIASPRQLISRLRDVNLALHARISPNESTERTDTCMLPKHGCAVASQVGQSLESSFAAIECDLNDSPKGPEIISNMVSDAPAFSARPFAGAISALQSLLLRSDDIREAYDDLTADDRGDLKELAKCIAAVDSRLFRDGGLLTGTSEVAIPLVQSLAVEKLLRVPSAASSSSDVASEKADQLGGYSLTRSSPQSSHGSLPAVGRLSELVDEKQREVTELQERCDRACSSSEEYLEASTLLASSREELRLLREFLGTNSEGVEQCLYLESSPEPSWGIGR